MANPDERSYIRYLSIWRSVRLRSRGAKLGDAGMLQPDKVWLSIEIPSMKLKQRIVFTLMMSFVLSFTMSGWVTFLNLNFQSDFFTHWIKAFLSAWPAAAVIAFMFTPGIQRLSARIVADA